MTEPLLCEIENRFTFYPITYQFAYDSYKKLIDNFWTVSEIDMSRDYEDLVSLTKEQQHFIKMVSAFFAGSDGIVNENLSERFINEIKDPTIRAYYSAQMFNETIHSETYSLIIDSLIKDPLEKSVLLNAVNTVPCVKSKADWALKHINGTEPFAKRVLAFVLVEGLQFSGSFCALNYLRTLNKCPGLTFANSLIIRDEGIHTDMGCYIYSQCVNKLSQDDIEDMFMEAVNIEKEFITESIPCQMLGMNSESMCEYIEYVCDNLLVELGYEKIYNSENPFPFMIYTSTHTKTNFFEKRVSEYNKATQYNNWRETFIHWSDF